MEESYFLFFFSRDIDDDRELYKPPAALAVALGTSTDPTTTGTGVTYRDTYYYEYGYISSSDNLVTFLLQMK